MKRTKLLVLVMVAALFSVFAAPAYAQDGPAITIDPASVDAAGEHELTISGSGFTLPIFVLPCEGAGGDPAVMAEGDATALCDIGSLTPASPDDDGNWEVTVTFNVPETGLVIAAGEATGAEAAVGVVTVGEAEAMEEEAMDEEESMEEESMEEEAMEEESMEEEAMEDESLPATGNESTVVTIIALTVVLAGAMVISTARRLHRI